MVPLSLCRPGTGEFSRIGWSSTVGRTTGQATLNLYYDRWTGNDSNPGTQASPMKTVQGVYDKYVKGCIRTCNINVFRNNTGTDNVGLTILHSYASGGAYTLNFYGDTSAAADRTGTASYIGSSATTMKDDAAADFTPYLGNDCFLKITSGNLNGISRRITGWDNGTHTYTVEAFPAAPDANASYTIDVRYPNRSKYKSTGAWSFNYAQYVYVYGMDVSGVTTGIKYNQASGSIAGCNIHGCSSNGVGISGNWGKGNAISTQRPIQTVGMDSTTPTAPTTTR